VHLPLLESYLMNLVLPAKRLLRELRQRCENS
jgi:hypothetical protein